MTLIIISLLRYVGSVLLLFFVRNSDAFAKIGINYAILQSQIWMRKYRRYFPAALLMAIKDSNCVIDPKSLVMTEMQENALYRFKTIVVPKILEKIDQLPSESKPIAISKINESTANAVMANISASISKNTAKIEFMGDENALDLATGLQIFSGKKLQC